MTTTTPPDLIAVKHRQQAAWSTGDYGIIGMTLDLVGEQLCEAVDLRSTEQVLDVATGNGNAALAAARRWCEVTGIDYVPALLEEGRARAAGDRLSITFLEGDAEEIPFPNASFDVVLSTFGVMFSANQERAAAELVRTYDRSTPLALRRSGKNASRASDGGRSHQRHAPPALAGRRAEGSDQTLSIRSPIPGSDVMISEDSPPISTWVRARSWGACHAALGPRWRSAVSGGAAAAVHLQPAGHHPRG